MSNKIKDIMGQCFSNLVVIENRNHGNWLCKCDCGNEILNSGVQLRAGKVKSCGCLSKTAQNKYSTTGYNSSDFRRFL